MPLIARRRQPEKVCHNATDDTKTATKISKRDGTAVALIKLFLLISLISVFLIPSIPSKLGAEKKKTIITADVLNIRRVAKGPTSKRRVVCIDAVQKSVVRAFQSRGFKTINLKGYNWSALEECYSQGKGVIMWTKHKPPKKYWTMAKKWQRHNWIPYQNVMSSKSKLLLSLNAYEKQTNRKTEFIPETFMLPRDRSELVERLNGGLNEPWVVKLSSTDNGIGIAMIGPESDDLKNLHQILQTPTDVKECMSQIREEIVFVQKDDSRPAAAIKKARDRSNRLNDPIIVQRYVCHELAYLGKKFDLRIYYLIASADPVVVFYHDGYLRVSPHDYNDKVFESTSKHLTNLGRVNATAKNTVSFAAWDIELKKYVAENPNSFSQETQKDPLEHIRRQIMSALANVVAANRKAGFHGHGQYTTMENGFALMVRYCLFFFWG